MRYSDSRFRSSRPERPPSRIEDITRRAEDYPGPFPDSFWDGYGRQARIVQQLRIDAEDAIESARMARIAIDEGAYEHRALEAMSLRERRDYAELQNREAARPAVVAHLEREEARLRMLDRHADMFADDASSSVSLERLEAEIGARADEWTLAEVERVNARMAKSRRANLGDGLVRGWTVGPPPADIGPGWNGRG